MMLPVAIVGSLIFMVLWSLAWRSRPRLAFGIFLGMAGACALVGIVWFSGIRHLPIWLPALPFALVAITLFGFGILAWRWGRNG
jgi:accessory gene regulator protein AgrB